MISVLINVFIFISVVSIVGAKLRVNVNRRSDYRYRLARSTLALLPLLGIHYAMTMFIKVGASESKTRLHIVTNFINVILTSLQGLLVSIIYCFCNAEVQVFSSIKSLCAKSPQDELEKTYTAWKLGRDVRDDANRRRSTLSNSQVLFFEKYFSTLESAFHKPFTKGPLHGPFHERLGRTSWSQVHRPNFEYKIYSHSYPTNHHLHV